MLLAQAIERGDGPAVQRLVAAHGRGILDQDERLAPCALTHAVADNQTHLVHLLLRLGADPNVPAPGSRRMRCSLLRHVAERGRPDLVAALTAHGALIDGLENDDTTALIETAGTPHTACAQALLQAGANVNAADTRGSCPLHVAAAFAPLAMTRLLLAHGARVEQSDHFGNTALHHAARHGQPDVARALVESGADPSRRTNDARTALEIAIASDHHETAEYLRGAQRARVLSRPATADGPTDPESPTL